MNEGGTGRHDGDGTQGATQAGPDRRPVVVTLEQALSMPYATLRFVHLGWRVIRIEPTPGEHGLPGDPNRYIGRRFAEDDRRSYFIAQNVGKESIALNLKRPDGQAALRRMIARLGVDVFCCNTLPGRYRQLGIDYETLAAVKPDLIWAGISAMGPDHPWTPGYDPATQAMVGYMELTGERDGPPMLSGVPLIDLKAGDEVYAGVLGAMWQRDRCGTGRRIDVSMLQAAASWLITTLPLIDFDCAEEEISRVGNEHRKFIPTNAYPTADGFIFMAIGADAQWRRLTEIPKFAAVANEVRLTNEGRHIERRQIHADIAAVTTRHSTAELTADFVAARIPHAPIQTVRQVREMAAIAGELTTTRAPDGRVLRMQPPATRLDRSYEFPLAPRYGEHGRAVLREAGFAADEIAALSAAGTIHLPDGGGKR